MLKRKDSSMTEKMAKEKEVRRVPNSRDTPILRFPEFVSEWKTNKLSDIAKFSKGKGISKSDIEIDGVTECIRYGELYTYYGEVINDIKSRTNVNISDLVLSEANDVIIPASGESTIDIATASCVLKSGIALGGDLNIIKTDNNGVFLSYYLNSKKKIEIANLAQGVSVVHLYSSQLASLTLNLPTYEEQNRISAFLTKLDERILTQSKIIEELNLLIKGIIQKIESDGKEKGWMKIRLRDVLTERKELNKEKFEVHSVSVSKGVVNQIEYLGRSFAAKNVTNYNVAHYGDIIYTKSPTGDFPFGIIKQCFVESNVALSPLYGVFKPKTISIGTLLHFYFNNPINVKNYLKSIIQKGAKNTINITNQTFLNNYIYLPVSQFETDSIGNMLMSLNKKIALEKIALDRLVKQKKYLLQNLFI